MKELGNNSFEEVIQIIETSRSNAYQKVNEELILMYQKIGKYLSARSQNASYGDSYIDSLSKHIQERFPGIKGFTRRGLYRMKRKDQRKGDNYYIVTVFKKDGVTEVDQFWVYNGAGEQYPMP